MELPEFTMNQKRIALVLFLAINLHLPVTSLQNSNNNDNNTTTNSYTSPHNSRPDDRIYNTYDNKVHGHVLIEVKDVSTSSVNVKWSLPQMTSNDSILELSVTCETSNGHQLSKKYITSYGSHRFQNLHANTSYVVCVYMLVKSKSSNKTVLHFNCHQSKTEATVHIPSLRTDSIIAVVLTLGYITAMIIIGYATWRWKRNRKEQDEAKQKLAIEDDDYDEDDGMINGGLRDNHYRRGVGGSGGGASTGVGGGISYGYIASADNIGSSPHERDTMRSSSHGLNNSDRIHRGSKGNTMGSVTFSESKVVLEREDNTSAEDVNGCLDFKRNSRGSAVKLTDLAENGATLEKKQRPKSQSVEDSPVKVTEISF